MPEDQFPTLYDAVDGEPSEEFVAALRSRLEAEVLAESAPAPMTPPVSSEETVVNLKPASGNRDTSRVRWLLGAAAAAAVLVVVAFALLRGDGEETTMIADNPSTATSDSIVPAVPAPPTTVARVVPAPPAGWSTIGAPECDIGQLAAGPDGVLWLGTAGLYRWDGAVWSHHTYEDGLPVSESFDPNDPTYGGGPCGSVFPEVTALATEADGDLWIATSDPGGPTGVHRFDGEIITSYPGIDPAEVGGALWVDADGSVWAQTTVEGGPDDMNPLITGVARLDSDGEWTRFPLDGPVSQDTGAQMDVGNDGTAWLVERDRALRLVDGAWETVDMSAVAGRGLNGLAVGPDGGAWTTTFGEGDPDLTVMHWSDGEWTTIDSPTLPIVSGQFVDSDGTFWVGLGGASPESAGTLGGLAAYDGASWTENPTEDGYTPPLPDQPFTIVSDGVAVWVTGPYSNLAAFTPE